MTRILVNSVGPKKPNLIINGGFDFWQRGTSIQPAFSNYPYSADRWQAEAGGGASGSRAHAQSTDVPNGVYVPYSVRMFISTPISSSTISAHQKIEAVNIAPYIGRTMTFSCWVKPTSINHAATNLRVYTPAGSTPDVWTSDASSNDILIASTAVSTVGVWQQTYVTFIVPASAINGLMISIQSTGNGTDPVECFITGAMLTEGSSPSAYFYRAGETIDQELLKCQRYYEKSYPTTVSPGTATTSSIIDINFGANVAAGTALFGPVRFKVEKRTTPTISYFTRAGGAGIQRYSNTSTLQDTVAGTVSGPGTSGFIVNSGNTVGSATSYIDFHFTADAEIA